MINEGRFETFAKTAKNLEKIDLELGKYGLGYNGGDPLYSKK